MRNIMQFVYLLTTLVVVSNGAQHDISTLKLLQIVHRHGDRAPAVWTKKDPFKDIKYWPAGFGELTAQGKYRMYTLGQFYRREYSSYLGESYSPHEVYVRSSSVHRCIESAMSLMAGAYPPKGNWTWNRDNKSALGVEWQPIPIETFIPKSQDTVLEGYTKCKAAEDDLNRVYNQSVIHEFEAKYKQLYEELTKITGSEIKDVYTAVDFYDTFQIEFDNNHFWPDIGQGDKAKQILSQLHDHEVLGYRYDWDSPILKRMRAGGLIQLLNENFKLAQNNTNPYKLYVYSTHGENIGAIMAALNLYNGNSPPFGTTLLFELHKSSDYFVRIYLQNSTRFDYTPTSQDLHPIPITDCNNQYVCPLTQYMESTKHLLYDNFEKDCTVNTNDSSAPLTHTIALTVALNALYLIFYAFIIV